MVGEVYNQLVLYGHMGVDEKALGQRLQKARQNAGLTQQVLCQKADLSYSTLAKIERGAIRAPSVFTVAAIALATGTSIEELLDINSSAPVTEKKTSKTGVKFIYFDLNGTLVRSYEKAFTRIAEETGLSVDSIETIYWRYDDDVCCGKISLDEFNRIMSEKIGIPNFDWASYYLDAVEPIPGMSELVSWAADNFEVGLLSGTMPTLIDGLAKQSKIPFSKFSKVIDSSVVKLLKYGPEIFEYAQKETGCDAPNILLVDDDKLSIINAGKAGWQTCRFSTYDPDASIEKIKTHLEF